MIIIGKKKPKLDYDTVMERTTEYAIYSYYLGRNFEIGGVVKSPFRKEKNPSFLIGNRGGFLHHTDLSDQRYKGNCIQLVEQLFNVGYNEALLKIDRDMALGITQYHDDGYEKNWTKTKAQEKGIEPPKNTTIHVRTRKFDATELAYWNQFHLDLADLKENNVYAIKEFSLNRSRYPLKKTELVFGYLYGDKWKIYWPFAATKQRKWKTNVPNKLMEDIELLGGCDVALVLKSKKEKMIARKFLTKCVTDVQSEGIGNITPENISFLQENVNHTYLIFDNDKVGVESCMYYNQFGFDYWNVPKSYREQGIKDLGELISSFGPDVLREEINKKIKL